MSLRVVMLELGTSCTGVPATLKHTLMPVPPHLQQAGHCLHIIMQRHLSLEKQGYSSFWRYRCIHSCLFVSFSRKWIWILLLVFKPLGRLSPGIHTEHMLLIPHNIFFSRSLLHIICIYTYIYIVWKKNKNLNHWQYRIVFYYCNTCK